MAPGTRSHGPVTNAQGQDGDAAGPVVAPTPLQAPVIPPGAPQAPANPPAPTNSHAPANLQAPANPHALAQPGALYQFGNPPLFAFTQEQIDARFALEQRKVEADLAAIEARTIRENEESRAKIAAIQSAAVTAAAPRNRVDEEEPVGEISPAALLVASRYPGLPKAEIARIFANKFRPENLYKLRHLKGREDKDRDENITIENGLMKLKRVTGTLRDFGSTWDIWSESFINYCMIMVDFFGTTFPTLHRVLLLYYTKVRKLSKIYEWQTAILPLAIDYHTEITTGNHTDVDAWTLPQDWIDQYCSPNHILAVSFTSKKRGATTALEGSAKKKVAGEVCRNFNTKGCTFKECAREHKCSDCGSKDHGAHTCTKPKQ